MATSPLPQVPSTSIDVNGISVCTATPSLTDPRAGTVYNLSSFAAAMPVWFHPVHDGRFLMLNRRRWHDVAPDGGIPGSFSSFSEDTTPSWTLVDGASGQRTAVPGSPMAIPMNTSVTSRVLVGVASRPPDQLYALSSVVIDGQSAAVVQRIHTLASGIITISAEEVLPTVTVGAEDVVIFDKGVQLVPGTPWLCVYGTDASGRVYRIRKPGSHVGVNTSTTLTTYATVVGAPQGWEYWTAQSGYSLNPDELAPMSKITTVGPMSFAWERNKVVMTTVEHVAGNYVGWGWTSVVGMAAKKSVTSIPLGTDAQYLGGGIQLMSTLRSSEAGLSIPYCTSTKVVTGGKSSLVNAWKSWPLA